MAKPKLWNERLRQARLERSLSQAELARKLYVSPKAVQRWERGKSYPQPHWRAELCEFFQLEDSFREFDSQLRDYSTVNYVMAQSGGLHALFDTFGNVKDPPEFAALLAGLNEALPQSLQRTIHNRFALDRYLRGTERSLTTCFVRTLAALQEELRCSIAMLIDTYYEFTRGYPLLLVLVWLLAKSEPISARRSTSIP